MLFVRKVQALVFPLSLCCGIVLISSFALMADLWFDQIFMQAWPVLIILISAIVIYSGVAPFDMVLIQAGYPGRQTILMTANTGMNLILNACLIPVYGEIGAASATAMAIILSIFHLRLLMRRYLGYSLRV